MDSNLFTTLLETLFTYVLLLLHVSHPFLIFFEFVYTDTSVLSFLKEGEKKRRKKRTTRGDKSTG